MESDDSCTSYLGYIKNDLRSNMAIAVSSWGNSFNTMSWLDQDTGCTGDCDNKPEVLIKNIAYLAGPDPPPVEFFYG